MADNQDDAREPIEMDIRMLQEEEDIDMFSDDPMFDDMLDQSVPAQRPQDHNEEFNN